MCTKFFVRSPSECRGSTVSYWPADRQGAIGLTHFRPLFTTSTYFLRTELIVVCYPLARLQKKASTSGSRRNVICFFFPGQRMRAKRSRDRTRASRCNRSRDPTLNQHASSSSWSACGYCLRSFSFALLNE